METIVVTRHQGLVDYLIDIGFINQETPVITHATVGDVKGKHVVGVLPMYLAQHCRAVTEVPMENLPLELRGKELTKEQVQQYAGKLTHYAVVVAETPELAAQIATIGNASV